MAHTTGRAGGQRSGGPKGKIPEFLTQIPAWCRWRYFTTSGGKVTKRPIGSTLDPETKQAFSRVASDLECAEGGIGLIFTGGLEWWGRRLLALDVDACVEPSTGSIKPWAQELLERYRGYAELSPSGTGLRIFLALTKAPRAVPLIKIPDSAPEGVSKRPEIQVFGCGPAGYVTVTGRGLPGVPDTPAVAEDLSWLLERYDTEEGSGEAVELPEGEGPKPTMTELDKRMLRLPQVPELRAGDWERLGLPSASEGWWRLVDATLQQCGGHGAVALEYLLSRTAYGAGLVDSRDPDRYARRDWVARDVARIATKAEHVDVHEAFGDGFPPAEEWEAPETKPKRKLIVQLAEFVQDARAQAFLYKRLLPAAGLAQIFGDPGCGKTPYAVSLALHVALGMDWFGYQLKRPGRVIYMIGEDPDGLRGRFQAQLTAIDPLIDLADVPVYVTTEPASLSDRQNATRWAKEILEVAGQSEDPTSLIVIDTQAANFGAGNENESEDMARFVFELLRLVRRTDALVLLVHHTGHKEKGRGRGSSVLHAAIDASFEVTRDGKAVLLTAGKAKNWAAPEPLLGYLVPVELRRDEDGDPVTAVTLQELNEDDAAFFDVVEPDGFDPNTMALLGWVAEHEDQPAPRNQIAKALGLTERQIQRLITKAEGAGLLLTTGSPRGQKAHALSKRGRRLLEGDEGLEADK